MPDADEPDAGGGGVHSLTFDDQSIIFIIVGIVGTLMYNAVEVSKDWDSSADSIIERHVSITSAGCSGCRLDSTVTPGGTGTAGTTEAASRGSARPTSVIEQL